MTNISFMDIKNYLNAIADKSGVIDGSPHKRFWNISYNDFINGNVNTQTCMGMPIPLIDKTDPLKSAFYTILIDSIGFCNKPQMPDGGPLITDPGYSITLSDGTNLNGQQIHDNIKSWLSNGFPETSITA